MKLLLIILHFLPTIDQFIGQAFGYWVAFGSRSLSHFVVPMVWERNIKEVLTIPFRVNPGMTKATWKWSIGGFIFGGLGILIPYLLLKHQFDTDQIRTGVNELYPVTLPMYIAVSFAISFMNPLMEEFYWRGFLYRKYRNCGGGIWVGVFFAIHHYIIFREWFEPLPIVVAMVGLAIVGVAFNWLYKKVDNIWPCLATHCAADIAIVSIGYTILF